MNLPEICVIIVNYGTADLAISAAESVLDRSKDDRFVHIHIVDNASPGKDAHHLQVEHNRLGWEGKVTLHLEEKNLGFGRGNNCVLETYQMNNGRLPDKIFLLNPDAALYNNAIDALAGFLEQTPMAGFAGARITKPDGTPATAAFRFPNVVAEFSQTLNFGPIARLLDRWTVPLSPDLARAHVDWVSGAAVMVRSEALMDVGLFDPGFFLYFEEVDLMHRASEAGWETWYVPEAQVIHAEGVATGVKSDLQDRRRRPKYWYHSWQRYHRKRSGRAGAILAACAYLSGLTGQYIIASVRRQRINAPLQPFGDFWRYSVLPLLKQRQLP